MTIPADDICRVLRAENDFLVASHVNPDGDALGATAAMGYVLAALGKRFTLYNPSGLPRHLAWLELPAPLATSLPEDGFQRVICLDCGDASRVGKELAPRLLRSATINIDHHLGTPRFADINWLDSAASSTGELVARLAQMLDIPLVGGLAAAVWLALVTDTGNFTYGNTSPEALRLAAELVASGLDIAPLNERIENQWTPAKAALVAAVLGELKLHEDGRVGLIRIPKALLARTGAEPADTEGLINFVRKLHGVVVAVALREDEGGRIKFSLRSVGQTNVQAAAASFGGGGHRNAAGGQVGGGMEEAQRQVLAAVRRVLREAEGQ